MKKRVMVALMILFILIYSVNLVLIFSTEDFVHPLTGSGITASVALTIAQPGETIIIHSPLNQTYNFSVGDNYTLDLNVSSDFNATLWTYDLWDRKHDTLVNNSIAFSPNITFNAVRWGNELIVYAINGSGDTVNATVSFYVYVPNSAPYFDPINSSIFICEDDSLSYYFNVTDLDEEVLQLSLTPTNPFYLDTSWTSASSQKSVIELFSGTLSQNDATNGADDWRTYNERIEVTDGNYSDTAYTNITAIAINNAPIIDTIGVQTVQTQGDNSTFYKVASTTDEEDGNENSSGINFGISYINGSAFDLFSITSEGVMNFTPNANQTGVYNITVCANDTGISNPFVNISSVCGQDGGSISTCQNFSLTVTNANRPPTIVSYYPSSLAFTAGGTTPLYFNVSNYDPDWTTPDTYWYVDGSLVEYDSGDLVEDFTHTFGCGVSGVKTVTAEITDGLENDSVSWTVTVNQVDCPTSEEGGAGGGGGGGGPICIPKWGCSIFGICQSAAKSLDAGLLTGYDYRNVIEECRDIGLSEESCGVQTRVCFDSSLCNSTYSKPTEVQTCYYTATPDCEDGIKNCHDNACELLVDCGGPCSPCPSCSDNVKNQGEEGVDCGGPCPWKCEGVKAIAKGIKPIYLYLMLILLLILIILVIIKIRRILRYRKGLLKETFK